MKAGPERTLHRAVAGAATSPASRPTKDGSTWPPSSTSRPTDWSAGQPSITCGRPGERRPKAACRQRRPIYPGDLPLGLRTSMHQATGRWPGRGVPSPAVGRPHRTVLGQRALVSRSSPPSSASSVRSPSGQREDYRPCRNIRLHGELVNDAPSARQPGLRSPADYESYHSLSATPIVSVKAERAQSTPIRKDISVGSGRATAAPPSSPPAGLLRDTLGALRGRYGPRCGGGWRQLVVGRGSSVRSCRTWCSIWSRMVRTVWMPAPAGSGRSQSRYRLPGKTGQASPQPMVMT